MQLLLRKITVDADNQEEYLDTVISGDVLVIGSSPRCDLQLLGAGVKGIHARLVYTGKKVELVAEKRSQFIYKNKVVRKAKLQAGDEFVIGEQRFNVVKAPAGFELALEWYYQPVPGELLENAYRTSIDQLRFSPRAVSWVLILLILLLAGAGPVADYWWRTNSLVTSEGFVAADNIDNNTDQTSPTTIAQRAFSPQEFTAQVTSFLEGVRLGRPTADSFWLSGPLLPAHEVVIGDHCEACHQQAFVQVQDAACAACHEDTQDHLNAVHPELPAYPQFSCQNCHKEHNEPMQIVSNSDKLCNDCHADLSPPVENFSTRGHPEFAATVLRPQMQNNNFNSVTWELSKISMQEGVQETNNLIYPHDVHLDPEAVTHLQRGDGLLCADCHELSSDGEHFAPITMERHCADCHELSFDVNNPQRQLPHGEPVEVWAELRAHFIERSFNPVDDGFERRRLPGRELADESCERDYECAMAQTQREAEKQFLQSGCVTCHRVETVAGAEAGEQWQVLPVRLSADWYANARFDHRSHLTPSDFERTLQAGDNTNQEKTIAGQNQVCSNCHTQAVFSKASTDVLMPLRSQCTQCHGSRRDGGNVALNCIACHGYHQANEFHPRGLSNANL